MKNRSREEWISLIKDTAHDRVPWNSKADNSPWDGFYRDYRDASAECRQQIDLAFLDCMDCDDARLLDEVIAHAYSKLHS